jgi:hypothetical protein
VRPHFNVTGHLTFRFSVLLSSVRPEPERYASTEREIIMLKFLQTSRINDLRLPGLLLGSMALIALMSATPTALAQGVPAGLLRLDPPQSSNDGAKFAEDQGTKVRSAYARSRKPQAQ